MVLLSAGTGGQGNEGLHLMAINYEVGAEEMVRARVCVCVCACVCKRVTFSLERNLFSVTLWEIIHKHIRHFSHPLHPESKFSLSDRLIKASYIYPSVVQKQRSKT